MAAQVSLPRTPPATSGADESGGRRLEGLAALRAATGGDWMEESLGLGPPEPSPPASPVPSASLHPRRPEPRAAAWAGDVDDEVTLGGDDEPLPSANRRPPVWPGDPATADADQTVIPDHDIPEPAGDTGIEPPERRLVPSRHCPDGHPNPPLADVCRVCGAAIDAAAPTVAILQPVLGRLVLDDGEASAIDRALVLGRRPDAAVAGMPAGSRLIAVGSATTVRAPTPSCVPMAGP